MPVERARSGVSGGLTRTRFADTPSMPSYLLFLAVGDFERVTRDVDGVELGVVVRRGADRTARNDALQAGEESLRYFTEYFGIRYPLPKLDMIGVPGAGGFGAMENWGAILYFDQYLLVDETPPARAERQIVFSIVAHEIAHQWFGNLVTMMWWDDLWLNEGFASWMAAKAIEARAPGLAALDGAAHRRHGDGDGARCARRHASRSCRPSTPSMKPISPSTTITYEKGLAVIRMLEAYVGEEDFRQRRARLSERAPLRQRAHRRSVDARCKPPRASRCWRSRAASPASRASRADGATAPIAGAARPTMARSHLTQRRFAMDDASRTDERWTVPVVARRVGGEPVRSVLPRASAIDASMSARCGDLSRQRRPSGFFRVIYDHANFDALTRASPISTTTDQLGLLLDYWAFGRSGDAPFTDYLELVERAAGDADPVMVVNTAEIAGAACGLRARAGPARTRCAPMAAARLQPYFARVGWDARAGETSNEGKLRGDADRRAGDAGR